MHGTAIFRNSPATPGSPSSPGTPGTPGKPGKPGSPRKACTDGFRGTVRGKMIKRVVFRLDGKRIAARDRSPFEVLIHASRRQAHGHGTDHVPGRDRA